MRKSFFLLALLGATALAGCMETDGERALAGVVGGAVVAKATDNDVLTTAAAAGLAMALCDDAGVCQ